MKKEISRNPSFTPSPKLRAHLNSHREGVTERLNNIFDRYAHLVRPVPFLSMTTKHRFCLMC
jgi:hypothetical protein